MILSKTTINELLVSQDPDRRLIITPLLDKEEQVRAAAIDVRLGSQFVLVNKQTGLVAIDPVQRSQLTEKLLKYQSQIQVPFGSGFYLHPHDFCLATTFEYICLPTNVGAYVIGRSSWGRLGLIIATATAVEPGFKGTIVLELANVGSVPIVLYPMMRIAQLVLHTTSDAEGRRQQ